MCTEGIPALFTLSLPLETMMKTDRDTNRTNDRCEKWRIIPVSYTHLDVYKRQAYIDVRPFFMV